VSHYGDVMAQYAMWWLSREWGGSVWDVVAQYGMDVVY
jgi:hypothetical protein